jgi:hypothetical protein
LETPATARYRALDRQLAAVLDYHLLRPAPRTPADSLTAAAVPLWLFGDESIVNEAACRRVFMPTDAPAVSRALLAKLAVRLGLLARDYFAVLLALALTAGWALRHGQNRACVVLTQLSFAALLLALATLLKLPPRLALPLLDFWLLANLAACGRTQSQALVGGKPLQMRLLLAATAFISLLYGAKTWHRNQVLQREQQCHELALAEIGRRTAGRTRIVAGADDLLKSLSPFTTYSLGAGPVLWLTGWPSHDPSQQAQYRQLSGQSTQAGCLRVLAAKPPGQVTWVLAPQTARWLNQRFRLNYRGRYFQLAPASALRDDSALTFYNIRELAGVY